MEKGYIDGSDRRMKLQIWTGIIMNQGRLYFTYEGYVMYYFWVVITIGIKKKTSLFFGNHLKELGTKIWEEVKNTFKMPRDICTVYKI